MAGDAQAPSEAGFQPFTRRLRDALDRACGPEGATRILRKALALAGAEAVPEEAVGYVRASELSRDRVEDARQVLSEGDEIEAQFVGVDRKNRTVSLSVKGREVQEDKEAVQEYSSRSAASGTTSLGDLLKEQMDSSRNDS